MSIYLFRSFERRWAIYSGAVEVLRMERVRAGEGCGKAVDKWDLSEWGGRET
jgi:hypothetical protein